jgi:hypothetical protein
MKLLRSIVVAAVALISCCSLAAQSSSTSASQQQNARPSQQPGPDPFAGVPAAKPADVDSIDHILAALYAVISGPAGPRDWERFRSLFISTARLTSATKAPDGSVRVRPNSVEDYATRVGAYFLKNGFFEGSIVNQVTTFGNIAQVLSSYESRHNAGEAPFARGINGIQLVNDGHRWWIVSIFWDEERPDNPLPAAFTKP